MDRSRAFNFKVKFRLLLLLGLLSMAVPKANAQQGNVLLIIADDLGVDAIDGFNIPGRKPTTPVLDSLRRSGITFTAAWAAPQCTPTRAAIMSGKYGIKTGVMRPPGNLDLEHSSVFTTLDDSLSQDIKTAVIGKWHISNPIDYDHPQQHSIDHYEGVFSASVADYYGWEKVENGTVSQEDQYVTSHFTDAAIDWVNEQNGNPWFLWLAHVAPHSPYHVPPAELHTVLNTGNNYGMYTASIEAMDTEIGRLIKNMSTQDQENTTIIFIGDNGTPGNVIQSFASDHAKSTVYEGGIRVPFFICGNQVDRMDVVDEQLVQVTDIHATVLELFGVELKGGLNNSLSLFPLLKEEYELPRWFNYVDYQDSSSLDYAIRGERYKYISKGGLFEEFYDMRNDILEENNLMLSLNPRQQIILDSLKEEAIIIRENWSCSDGIQNGDENGIDVGCLGVSSSDIPEEGLIDIFPNPSNGQVNIVLPHSTNWTIVIRDIIGKTHSENSFSGDHTTLIIPKAGLYTVSVYDNDKLIGNKRVVVW